LTIFTSILNRLPRSILGVGEQAVQSLYSFLVVAIAARLLTQLDFGTFSLVWSAYPVALLVFAAVLTKPISIVYPASSQKSQYQQELYCYDVTNYGWWIIILAALLYILSIYMLWDKLAIILFGVGLLALRMMHELHRRLGLAQGRSVDVLLYSLKVLLPGIFILPVVLYFNLSESLKLPLFFYAGVVWSLFILPVAFLRPKGVGSLENKDHHSVWGGYYHYGRPLLLAAAIDVIFKHTAPYIMVMGAGALEAGVWAVGRLLVGPAQIILMGIVNAALPVLRNAYVNEGVSFLRIKLLNNAVLVFFFYMLPLLVMGIYAELLIDIAIGEVYVGAVKTLQVYCVAFAVMGFTSLASLYLNACGEVRQQVSVSIASSSVYLLGILYIFQNQIGAIGIAMLVLVAEVVSFIVLSIYIIKFNKNNKVGAA